MPKIPFQISPNMLSLLQNSLHSPFDKLRTGFDTRGERRCWVVDSRFSVRGEVSNHERKYFCKSFFELCLSRENAVW